MRYRIRRARRPVLRLARAPLLGRIVALAALAAGALVVSGSPASAATLTDVTWAVDNNMSAATGVHYTWTFTTVTAGTIADVTLTVPTGTAGTPTVASVFGLGAGTVSMAGTTVTYTVTTPAAVAAGTPCATCSARAPIPRSSQAITESTVGGHLRVVLGSGPDRGSSTPAASLSSVSVRYQLLSHSSSTGRVASTVGGEDGLGSAGRYGGHGNRMRVKARLRRTVDQTGRKVLRRRGRSGWAAPRIRGERADSGPRRRPADRTERTWL